MIKCMSLVTMGVLAVLTLAGCGSDLTIEMPKVTSTQKPAPELRPAQSVSAGSEVMENRFSDAGNQTRDAVQEVVELTKKYDRLFTQTAALQEEKNKMFMENVKVRQQNEQFKTEVDNLKAELAEANEFLKDMHLELNKWKSDVLGFRSEMKQAQVAQMTALAKILKILGAEDIDLNAGGN